MPSAARAIRLSHLLLDVCRLCRVQHQAQPQGRLRKPCEGHTVSVVGKKLYVLFGKHEDDQGNPICPPMQVLDTETMVLSSPPFEPGPDGRQNAPADREGHTAPAVDHRIFVFGLSLIHI